MKLYVCYGTFQAPLGHACANAHRALKDAGHSPQVKRTYGWGALPDFLNPPQRHRVKKLTGSMWVPVLELDDGTVVSGSSEIIEWAKANPAVPAG